MKITSIQPQQKNDHRISVFVDGVYRFSLDIAQYGELGVKVGREYTEEELVELETESEFGKLYTRTLEYCLMRPHSAKEVRDYLYKKTQATKVRSRKTGELKDREGVPVEVTRRVYDRLVDRGYIDDNAFTRYWVENRQLRKGVSRRKLQAELREKGVPEDVVEKNLMNTSRSDEDEIKKVVAKKRARYDDQKLLQYLIRQGFSYDDSRKAISQESEVE